MSSPHPVLSASVEELNLAREELISIIESIDRGLDSMSRYAVDSINMFHKQSLFAVDGGLKRCATFKTGLDDAVRRLNAGMPIQVGETKKRSVYAARSATPARRTPEKVAEPVPPFNQSSKPDKPDSVQKDLQELMRAIVREELSKAVATEQPTKRVAKRKAR